MINEMLAAAGVLHSDDSVCLDVTCDAAQRPLQLNPMS